MTCYGVCRADEYFNVNSICLAVAVFSWPVWCLPCRWQFQRTFHICRCCNILMTCLVLPMQVCVQASSTQSPRRFCSTPSTTPVGSHQHRSITLDRATDNLCHHHPKKPDSDCCSCCLDVYGQRKKEKMTSVIVLERLGSFLCCFHINMAFWSTENSNSGGLTDTRVSVMYIDVT